MEQKEVAKGKYWVGVPMPGINELDTDLHVTLCWLGERTEEELNAILEDVKKLENDLFAANGGLVFKLGDLDMFGEKNDIPVIRCHVLDDKVAEEAINSFHEKYYKKDPGSKIDNKVPKLHISFKTVEEAKAYRNLREIATTWILYVKKSKGEGFIYKTEESY